MVKFPESYGHGSSSDKGILELYTKSLSKVSDRSGTGLSMSLGGEFDLDKTIDLKELCEIEDQQCLTEIEDFENSEPSEDFEDLAERVPSDGNDNFYKSDPMFQFIENEDIIEIYKRIKSALINQGDDIVAKFGYIYQLNLTPGPS